MRIGAHRQRSPVDVDEFAALYRRHIDEVYGFMDYHARNHFEAEDLTADAFERALRYFHSFDPTKGEFRTWLFVIAANVVRHHQRSRSTGSADVPIDAALEMRTSLEPNGLGVEERADLREALAGLSDREYRAIGLRFGGGLTNREIARVTGISESNVGTILHRSLTRIARVLR